MILFILILFALTYLGMALGRVPGLGSIAPASR